MEVLVLRIAIGVLAITILWPRIRALAAPIIENVKTKFAKRDQDELAGIVSSLQEIHLDVLNLRERLATPAELVKDNAELQQVYVQSLAGITKGLDTLLDRQS